MLSRIRHKMSYRKTFPNIFRMSQYRIDDNIDIDADSDQENETRHSVLSENLCKNSNQIVFGLKKRCNSRLYDEVDIEDSSDEDSSRCKALSQSFCQRSHLNISGFRKRWKTGFYDDADIVDESDQEITSKSPTLSKSFCQASLNSRSKKRSRKSVFKPLKIAKICKSLNAKSVPGSTTLSTTPKKISNSSNLSEGKTQSTGIHSQSAGNSIISHENLYIDCSSEEGDNVVKKSFLESNDEDIDCESDDETKMEFDEGNSELDKLLDLIKKNTETLNNSSLYISPSQTTKAKPMRCKKGGYLDELQSVLDNIRTDRKFLAHDKKLDLSYGNCYEISEIYFRFGIYLLTLKAIEKGNVFYNDLIQTIIPTDMAFNLKIGQKVDVFFDQTGNPYTIHGFEHFKYPIYIQPNKLAILQ